ncbi:MAG TPA: hypothetical protein ENI14_03990 [Thermoplasmatales archaeon]|nr:hypothetical protein [Thermoplasmatales archaeon]
MKRGYISVLGIFMAMIIFSMGISSLPVHAETQSIETTYIMFALIKDKDVVSYGNTSVYRFIIVRGFALTIAKADGGKTISRSYMKNLQFAIIDGKWLFTEGEFKGILTNHFVLGVYKLKMNPIII